MMPLSAPSLTKNVPITEVIGADIGPLGEDAAAEPREDRYQRGAKAERDHGFERRAQFVARKDSAQDEIIAAGAEQPEAHHQHPGDRARLERDVEPGGEP